MHYWQVETKSVAPNPSNPSNTVDIQVQLIRQMLIDYRLQVQLRGMWNSCQFSWTHSSPLLSISWCRRCRFGLCYAHALLCINYLDAYNVRTYQGGQRMATAEKVGVLYYSVLMVTWFWMWFGKHFRWWLQTTTSKWPLLTLVERPVGCWWYVQCTCSHVNVW